MIDFLSTRSGATPQDKCCAALIAAVIAEAVRDASQGLTPDERRAGKNYSTTARQALRYLFGPIGALTGPVNPFSAHARLIGLSAVSIRRGLLQPGTGTDLGYYCDARRRALQTRLAMSEYAPS